MDDGLKQRLIGAVVLLALGVIFLPVLFERDPMQPVDRDSQIPPAPEIVIVDLPVTEEIEVVDPAPDPDVMYIPDEKDVVDLAPETIGLDQEGIPKSWVLQVASFRRQEAAEDLRADLVEQGFAAYTRSLKHNGEPMTRVLVGPKLDKNALVIDKQKIDEMVNVDAILLEFKPE